MLTSRAAMHVSCSDWISNFNEGVPTVCIFMSGPEKWPVLNLLVLPTVNCRVSNLGPKSLVQHLSNIVRRLNREPRRTKQHYIC